MKGINLALCVLSILAAHVLLLLPLFLVSFYCNKDCSEQWALNHLYAHIGSPIRPDVVTIYLLMIPALIAIHFNRMRAASISRGITRSPVLGLTDPLPTVKYAPSMGRYWVFTGVIVFPIQLLLLLLFLIITDHQVEYANLMARLFAASITITVIGCIVWAWAEKKPKT